MASNEMYRQQTGSNARQQKAAKAAAAQQRKHENSAITVKWKIVGGMKAAVIEKKDRKKIIMEIIGVA
jgi:hypothetical protein